MQSSFAFHRQGFALIVVLMFVALLAGIVTVCLTRAGVERQLAHHSLQQLVTDEVAHSGMSSIIADLEQEIAAGSASTTIAGTTIYTPTSPRNIIPQRNAIGIGSSDLIPNLVRQSSR